MQTWPNIPPLPNLWMTRRARRWRSWLVSGQAQRFQADFRAATGGPRRDRERLREYGWALRAEWRRRIEQGPAGNALRRADHPNYLGDRAVVRGLVDGWFALQIARAGGAVPHDAIMDETARLARIFAGEDPAYPPIGGWNSRALLGEELQRTFTLPDAPFATILSETLGTIGLRVLDVLRGAEGGSIEPNAAVAQLQALAVHLTDTLLGHANG